ncbi:hypothetical protein HYC85_017402 [Camellia sinensis]|uniref:Disease resistance R13L4/SHOC-2-like LRR domain-containing protein n=1 Tax=Camellia sinensis TaxID=4442 RepID=A0A7J7GT20_CAMSI|nr:hypothetical protein HYC85_017402 [Camellia sinensis]
MLFGDANFITTLEDYVKVSRMLPEELMEVYDFNISNIPNFRVQAWATAKFYLEEVYPVLTKQRYLPPEIGCLKKLEYLDLSFNKMRSLPTEITYLNALISLKVTNNKLVELPSGLSSLQRLETLDLSNNRLSSLGCLELDSMHILQKLNLQIFPI